jgi:membrane associated rhomboid family serine protease
MGILPRDGFGLLGIITAPLIHGDFSHLISNTFPIIVLGWIIFFFYPKVSVFLFTFVYILTGLLVWLLARQVYHIGASGLVYGFVSFLFFSGIFRKDNKSVALALIITFLYGGLVWGVRKIDPPSKKYDWEDEEDDFDVNELEVSYDPEKNKFNL